jgi:hypothetical protein
MSDVPSNLIPTRVTQLPLAPVADENSLMMIVYQGNNYQIRVGDLLSVAGVPTSRQVIAGTGMTGGGQLSNNVTLSIANGGVGTVQLANSGVTPGTYGGATSVPVLTVDATGRVTAATTASISLSGFVPTSREVIAGTGLNGGGALNANITLNANLSNAAPQLGFQSGSAGVSTDIARADHKHPAVDLSSDDQVDNILRINNGGTGRSLTMQPGAVVWSGADGLYVGPAGNVGQVLVSGGSGAPTWGSTLIVAPVPANTMFAGPVSGGNADPVFRTMVNADLPDSGVVPNTYGSGALTPVLVINSKGVITSASTTAVTPAWSNVTGTPTTVAGYGITDAVTLTGVQTITGKTIDASLNTLSNIPNNALNNSIITVNGSTVSLGGSITVTATATHALTIGTGLSGTSYNGSAPVTIANTGVLSFSGGTTGLTPNTATTGAITLGGVLAIANGGTGASTAGTAPFALKGANSDITSLSGITGGISTANHVLFSNSPTSVPTGAGTLFWNSSEGTLDLIMRGGNVSQHIGEELFYTARNATGSSIAKGTPLMATGVTAGSKRIEVSPAIANGTIDQIRFVGLASESIANGTNGLVTAFGYIRNINTSGALYGETWADGDILYASPTTAGFLTNVEPAAPNLKIVVAIVIDADNNFGVLLVRPTAYPPLRDLSDVNVSSLTNGDALVYDGTDLRWENRAQSTLAVGTATNLAGGAASQIPYQTGAGATAFIANGTAGQVLTSAGAGVPVWSGISGGTF